MEIRAGMIGFSGGNSFIQKCIKFFTRSIFSHSFVTFNIKEELYVLETTSTLICPTPFKRKDSEDNYIEMWRLKNSSDTELFINRIEQCCHDTSGKWYAYLAYVWFIYAWFMLLFGVEKDQMWEWCKGGISCTEETSNPLAQTFLSMFKYKDLNTFTPEKLRKLMLNYPAYFECLGWYKQ